MKEGVSAQHICCWLYHLDELDQGAAILCRERQAERMEGTRRRRAGSNDFHERAFGANEVHRGVDQFCLSSVGRRVFAASR